MLVSGKGQYEGLTVARILASARTARPTT